MSIKLLFSFAVFSILLSFSGVCPASDYIVTLVNGESLPVNSYTVKGNRLILNYPLGSAEIAMSQVISVHDSSGKMELLQMKGEPIIKASPAAGQVKYESSNVNEKTDRQYEPRSVVSQIDIQPASSPFDSRASSILPAGLRPDPMASEIDGLIDRYSGADEMQAEAAEKELDLAFAAFFDE